MFILNYNPKIDDLFLYDDTNTGYPTGINPDHPLYGYKKYFLPIGVRSRAYSTYQKHPDYPNGPPAGTPIKQYPNYYNNNQVLSWWVGVTTLGSSVHYTPTKPSDSPSIPEFSKKTTQQDARTLKYWENLNFTTLEDYGPFYNIYTHVPGNLVRTTNITSRYFNGSPEVPGFESGATYYQISNKDYGFLTPVSQNYKNQTFLRTISLASIAKLKNIDIKLDTDYYLYNDFYLWDGQDRVIPVSLKVNFSAAFLTTFVYAFSDRIQKVWDGDSSGLLLYADGNEIFSIGHILAFTQGADYIYVQCTLHSNETYPVFDYLVNKKLVGSNYICTKNTETVGASSGGITAINSALTTAINTTTNKISELSPQSPFVPPSPNYSQISSSPTGGFLAYIDSNGTVHCVGDFSVGSENYTNGFYDYGQTNVPENLGVCKQVECGYQHTLALKIDGTVQAWGSDANAQGEFGTKAIQYQLTQANKKVIKISCGANHNLALLEDGSVIAWGQNEGSQLSDVNTYWTKKDDPDYGGNGYLGGYQTQSNSLFFNYPELSPFFGTFGIVLGRQYRCSATVNVRNADNCESPFRISQGYTAYDGTVIPARSSVVGSGWENSTNAPYDYQFSRQSTGITGHVNYSGGGWSRDGNTYSALGTSNRKYIDIAAGRTHNLLLTENKTIETWGANFYYVVTGSGQHSADGRGTCDYENESGANCFLRAGTGVSPIPWGDNTAPTVKNLKIIPNTVKAIGTSYYNSAVIKNDGSLFVWDRNDHGESLPETGLPSGNFKKIKGGYHHFIALTETGEVYCWGENYYGQCNVPVNLGECVDIGAGRTYSFARKVDGSIQFWGDLDPLGGDPNIQLNS